MADRILFSSTRGMNGQKVITLNAAKSREGDTWKEQQNAFSDLERKFPNFILIGANKGGTTSFYNGGHRRGGQALRCEPSSAAILRPRATGHRIKAKHDPFCCPLVFCRLSTMPVSFSTLPLSARTSAVSSPIVLDFIYAAHSPSSAGFGSSGFLMSRLVPEATKQVLCPLGARR
jgi:hypothetical protein